MVNTIETRGITLAIATGANRKACERELRETYPTTAYLIFKSLKSNARGAELTVEVVCN